MQRKTELVIEPRVAGARAEDGQFVARPRLDAGPGADNGGAAHHRK